MSHGERDDLRSRMRERRTALPPGARITAARGVGVVIGGPYNSGVLATGPRVGAHYNYAPAPDWVLERAGRLQAICARHGVRLVDAAFRFPLLHPAVVSVIPGGQGQAEMASNIAAARAEVPGALWQDLAAEGLLPAGQDGCIDDHIVMQRSGAENHGFRRHAHPRG